MSLLYSISQSDKVLTNHHILLIRRLGAKSFFTTQQFPGQPRIYLRFVECKSSLLYSKQPNNGPSLDRTRLIQSTVSHSISFKRYFNIILPPTPQSCAQFRSSRFPNQNPVCISILPMHATCAGHFIFLILILTIFPKQIFTLIYMTKVFCSTMESCI